MNELEDDFKENLAEAHIKLMSDEELGAHLMEISTDPDAPGDGITSLSDRQLVNLLHRRGKIGPLLARLPDATIKKLAEEILSRHPQERDHELSDGPPGPGQHLGHMSDRQVIVLARKIFPDWRRDAEPTDLRSEKGKRSSRMWSNMPIIMRRRGDRADVLSITQRCRLREKERR